jgi:hypothetical protein
MMFVSTVESPVRAVALLCLGGFAHQTLTVTVITMSSDLFPQSEVGTAPGVAGLALREIPNRDRTTPAGRFVGGFGPSIDAGRVLWVDYDSAVSIHPTATGVPAERRVERLASPSPDDNRITHGCINVSPEFYDQIMRPTFERGGLFYILPDAGPLAETFPEFVQSRANAEPDDGRPTRPDRQ